MNQIDFLKYNQFPLSTETLSALQDMIILTARIASLGGQNYILSGCIEQNNVVSPGYLVVAGEILPFEGGPKSTYITIVEEKSSVNVYGDSYQDIYISRKAVFGSGSPKYSWSSFNNLRPIAELSVDIANLKNELTYHTSNHTVQWNNITGKPSSYPPVQHTHDWNSITSKPTTFSPSIHSHPGLGVFLGYFDKNGTSVTKYYGSFDVGVARLATGMYKLIHNIGHTNYLVIGVGGENNTWDNKTISIRSNIQVNANYCVVVTSDDATPNDCDIRFCILSFQ